MKKIRTIFDIFVEDEITNTEARQYIYYKLNIINEIKVSHPMADKDWPDFKPSILKMDTIYS